MSSQNFHHCDCREFMKGVPDKFYDLAIVDPPYGIGVDEQIGHSKKASVKKYDKKQWDENPPDKEYFKELFRVSKNQIIWGANHFIENMPVKNSPCWIIWDKNKSGDFADAELAWCSFLTAVRIFKFTWNGMIQENMKDKEVRIHITQKPVALYKWILKKYAKPGDKILDTHGGSGSIAIACFDLGFDLDICEKDEEIYLASRKRYKSHIRQIRLF